MAACELWTDPHAQGLSLPQAAPGGWNIKRFPLAPGPDTLVGLRQKAPSGVRETACEQVAHGGVLSYARTPAWGEWTCFMVDSAQIPAFFLWATQSRAWPLVGNISECMARSQPLSATHVKISPAYYQVCLMFIRGNDDITVWMPLHRDVIYKLPYVNE